jgi:5-methylcytosine-specific restriction endonuclease McrA
MRRTPLRPSLVPIPRYAELPRSTTPIRARKKDPAKRRWAKLRDPAWCAKVRETACVVPPLTIKIALEPGFSRRRPRWLFCWGRTECAHVKPRSTGGADRGNTLGLCKRHHAQQHAIGLPAFEKLYRLDLSAIALSLDAESATASVEAAS